MTSGRGIVGPAVALLVIGALILGGLVVLVVLILPGNDDLCGGDDVVQAGSVSLRGGAGSLSAAERRNAAAVIAEGRRRNMPKRAIVIALAVASQESHFTNYANDGKGGDLSFTQVGIEQSLDLPHEAVGTDHGSMGVFQQQWPWWGMMSDLMNPARAAGKFYAALRQIRGWMRMPVTVAAQRVQRSAYPRAYADDESLARELLAGASTQQTTNDTAVFTGNVSNDCDEQVGPTATVAFPLPRGSGYLDQHNWGNQAAVWSGGHTGTDLSVACGTPVLAATNGKVIIRTDQGWAGRWLVEVSTGTGKLATWYAHMRALKVAAGQQVSAGQQIGEVGDLGNATGCHLHFEVHPRGGSIYEDNVNPSAWLHKNVGRHVGGATPVDKQGFVLATFNTLGTSHTSPHGNKPWMAPGPHRTRGMIKLLERHHIDVAGLQEFQRPQHQTFVKIAGDEYGVYSPSSHDTDNSIVWRRDKFQIVSGSSFAIPYFNGSIRRMPIVRLRSRSSGRNITLINVHNPADTKQFPRQGRWRARALSKEVAMVRRLGSNSSGPVLVTGDMNDHQHAYCAFSQQIRMLPAHGSRPSAGCRPPRRAGIDLIFGVRGVRFSGYGADRSRLVHRTTDHPVIFVRVSY